MVLILLTSTLLFYAPESSLNATTYNENISAGSAAAMNEALAYWAIAADWLDDNGTQTEIDNLSLTWDTSMLYLAFENEPGLELDGSADLFIALDTRPGGSTYAPLNKGVNFTGVNLPDIVMAIFEGGDHWLLNWNGSAWVPMLTNASSAGGGTGNEFVEAGIPLSELGNPNSFNLSTYITENGTGTDVFDLVPDNAAGVQPDGNASLNTDTDMVNVLGLDTARTKDWFMSVDGKMPATGWEEDELLQTHDIGTPLDRSDDVSLHFSWNGSSLFFGLSNLDLEAGGEGYSWLIMLDTTPGVTDGTNGTLLGASFDPIGTALPEYGIRIYLEAGFAKAHLYTGSGGNDWGTGADKSGEWSFFAGNDSQPFSQVEVPRWAVVGFDPEDDLGLLSFISDDDDQNILASFPKTNPYGLSPMLTDEFEYLATADKTHPDDHTLPDAEITTTILPSPSTGRDRTILLGQTLGLSGSGSTDDSFIFNYAWNLPLGQFSLLFQYPYFQHQFTEIGNHTLMLTVRDPVGLEASDMVWVNVTPDVNDPVAHVVSTTPSDPTPGLNRTVSQGTLVQMDGSSSTDDSGIENYTWSFLNGPIPVTSYEPVFLHSFALLGNHTLTLTVRDLSGNDDSLVFWINVVDTTPPIANITTTTDNNTKEGLDVQITQGRTVFFNGSRSSDDRSVVNWTWNLTNSTGVSKLLYGQETAHTFFGIGNHSMNLTVRDEAGNAGWAEAKVFVEADNTPPSALVATTTNLDSTPGTNRDVLQGQFIFLFGSGSADDIRIFNWTWTIENSGGLIRTLYGVNVSNQFMTTGWHIVNLTVRDGGDNTDINSVWVNVSVDDQPPVANATSTLPPDVLPGTDRTVSQGTLLGLDGTNSTDNSLIENYTWTLELDGALVTSLYGPEHQIRLMSLGAHYINLTVTDAMGQAALDNIKIDVVPDLQPPVAGPGMPLNASQYNSFHLDGSDSTDDGLIVNYTWRVALNDTTFYELYGETVQTSHPYIGTHEVLLTVMDMGGNTDQASTWITIMDGFSPVANIMTFLPDDASAGTNLSGLQGLNVLFNGSASSDNVEVLTYAWDIRLGAIQIANHSGAAFEHTFHAFGNHTVNLTVTDGAGNQDHASIWINITEDIQLPVAVVLVTTALDPVPALNRTILQGMLVYLDGSTSFDNGYLQNWSWNISLVGSGSVLLNGSMVQIDMDELGNHLINLTVRDGAGLFGSVVFWLNVTPDLIPPDVIFWTTTEWNPTQHLNRTIMQGELVTFNGSGTTDQNFIVEYEWEITLGAGLVAEHDLPLWSTRILTVGNHTVLLRVTDAAGLFGEMVGWMNVLPDLIPPVAVAKRNFTLGQGTALVLDGRDSTDNVVILNWTWSFNQDGGGVNIFGSKVHYRFDHVGNHTITLYVRDGAGNIGFDSVWVNVYDTQPPDALAFSYRPPSQTPGRHRVIVAGTRVLFNGSDSNDNVGVANHTWIIAKNSVVVSTLEGESVEFLFSDIGNFTVELMVIDLMGLSDTDRLFINVTYGTPPTAVARSSLTPDGVIGRNLTVYQGQSFILNGSLSTDDQEITLWAWMVYNDTGLHITYYGEFATVTIREPGVYRIFLTVTDNGLLEGDDELYLSVLADDISPISDPGSDQTAFLYDAVQFNGTGSSDNSEISSYTWTFIVGGELITLYGSNPDYSFNRTGNYIVTLTVKDLIGNQASNTTRVSVGYGDDRPIVIWVSPNSTTDIVFLDSAIMIAFSKQMQTSLFSDALTITSLNGTITMADGMLSWLENDTVMMFNPYIELLYDTTYTVSIDGLYVRDIEGNYLDATDLIYAWSFTTLTLEDANAPPSLSRGVIDPTTGTSTTLFEFRVMYRDTEGLPPESIVVIIDGKSNPMSYDSGTNSSGAFYVFRTLLLVGPHVYHFRASDGVNTVWYNGSSTSPDFGIDVKQAAAPPDDMPFYALAFILVGLIALMSIMVQLRKNKARKRQHSPDHSPDHPPDHPPDYPPDDPPEDPTKKETGPTAGDETTQDEPPLDEHITDSPNEPLDEPASEPESLDDPMTEMPSEPSDEPISEPESMDMDEPISESEQTDMDESKFPESPEGPVE